MTKKASASTLILAALLVALSIGSSPLFAQAADEGQDKVVVVASRISHEQDRHIGSTTVSPVTSLDATVSHGDLDLTLTKDMKELERRVEVAANQICEQLAKDSPMGEPKSTSVCVRRAVDDAMEQIEERVEKANGS